MNTVTSNPEPNFAAFIGLDWADEKHAYAVCLPDGSKPESGELTHTPQSLQEWAHKLRERFHGQPVAIALELSRGPLVWALVEHSFITLYPVTPHRVAQSAGGHSLSTFLLKTG